MKHMLIYSIIYLMYILDIPTLTRFTLCFCNTPLCNTVPRHMGGKASTLKIQSLLMLLTVLFLVLSWQIQILYTCLNHDPIDISVSKVGVPSAVHDHQIPWNSKFRLYVPTKYFSILKDSSVMDFDLIIKIQDDRQHFFGQIYQFSAGNTPFSCFSISIFSVSLIKRESVTPTSIPSKYFCYRSMEHVWGIEDNAHMFCQIRDTPR